jgi:hypothetical protein
MTIEPIKEIAKIPSKPFIEEPKEKVKPKETAPAPRKIIIVEEDTPLEMVQISDPKVEATTQEPKEIYTTKPKAKVVVVPEVVDLQKQKILDEKLKMEEKAKLEVKKAAPKVETKPTQKIIIDDREIEEKVAFNTPKNASNKESNKMAAPAQNKPKSTYVAPKMGLVYKIQVKASQRKIDENDIVYGSFPDIKESAEDGMYKYLTGEFKSIDEAKKHREYVKMKGFNDAFIVKYENGVRIK